METFTRLSGKLYDINFTSADPASLSDARVRLQAIGLLRRVQAAGSNSTVT